jgi:hypothetical protein
MKLNVREVRTTGIHLLVHRRSGGMLSPGPGTTVEQDWTVRVKVQQRNDDPSESRPRP